MWLVAFDGNGMWRCLRMEKGVLMVMVMLGRKTDAIEEWIIIGYLGGCEGWWVGDGWMWALW